MSELNKIVTNFPMSLSQDENSNLALTLSAVLEGGGGGGVANAIWRPDVDQYGLMTWSWETFPDSANPPGSVNIKGPRGESGAPGRDGTDGTNGKDGTDGKDGENGKTPQIRINSSNDHWEWRYSGASEWTDLGVVASGAVGPQGIPGVSGASGAPGAKGQDGYSPSVTTSEIPSSTAHPQGGTSVTITDKTGDHQFDVWNGINGEGASVNLLDGSGIHIEQNGINYTIGVSADYALKSELPDVTDMATKTWVGQQGYLTSVPDTYATKEYANDTSANALSQAQSWVGTQGFLTQADLSSYATETYVANASAETLSEADGRYMRKETDSTLEGTGTSADKLRISDTVMNQIKAKSTITSAAGNVFTVSGGAGTEPNKNFVYSGVNYKAGQTAGYVPQQLFVVASDNEIVSLVNGGASDGKGSLFFRVQ